MFKKLLVLILGFTFAFIGLEASLFVVYSMREGNFISAQTLFKKYYYFDQMGSNGCSWGSLTAPHPYWQHYYHNHKECLQSPRNNLGMRWRDVEYEKNTEFYNVLFFGGSVAEMTANLQDGTRSVLETQLNKDWKSPNGKPFRIVSFALTASKMPTAMIQSLMFYNRGDAAINLEGYNEWAPMELGWMFEAPSSLWQDYIVSLDHPFLALGYKGLMSWLRSPASDWSKYFFSHYFFATQLNEKITAYWNQLSQERAPFPPLPREWEMGKKKAYYLKSYESYLSQFHKLYRDHEMPSLTFIQPVPRLFKILTAVEEKNVGTVFDSRGYTEMIRFIEDLPQEEIPHESLAKVFEKNNESLYIDHIHTNDTGTKILIQELSAKVGQRFKWQKRNSSGTQ